MAKQIQLRRGTEAENNAFTGALAELTVDTTNKSLRLHDGVTAGGVALVNSATNQTIAGVKTFTSSPTAPTPTAGDNSTKIATTAFVQANADIIPTGAVFNFATSTPPNGFLECDGSAISRTTYANLFNAIGELYGAGDGSTTFNIPDLRGEFIRGWDNGRGIDSGRVIGTFQIDMFKAHTHLAAIKANDYPQYGATTDPTNDEDPVVRSETGVTGGTETRPRNIAMMYCIKY
jgi:phage-related tail fiber protein